MYCNKDFMDILWLTNSRLFPNLPSLVSEDLEPMNGLTGISIPCSLSLRYSARDFAVALVCTNIIPSESLPDSL